MNGLASAAVRGNVEERVHFGLVVAFRADCGGWGWCWRKREREREELELTVEVAVIRCSRARELLT